MEKLMKPGVKVVPGKDWKWNDFGGNGKGTVVQARFSQIKRYHPNLNSACKNTLHKLIFN